MPWVTEDTVGVGKTNPYLKESENSGEFRNPDFPSTVGSNEEWEGSIDSVNVGESEDTFRIVEDGSTIATFDLKAGESTTTKAYGTGPSQFTLTLQRRVEKKKPSLWEKYKKWIAIGSVVTVGATGYVATR